MRVNPLVTGGYFSFSDIYGVNYGTSTLDETAVESTEQQALANVEESAPNPKTQNHIGILTWLGIIILFIFLFSVGGK